MTCASCANRIERKLNKLDGVTRDRQLRHREGDASSSTPARSRPTSWSRRSRPPATRPTLPSADARRSAPTRSDHDRAAARAGSSSRRVALAAGAADLDGAGAAVRQLAVARAQHGDPGRALGRAGPSTGRRGRTSGTAPRRWTRSSRVGVLAAWLWSLYALFIGDAGMTGHAHGLRPDPRAPAPAPTRSTSRRRPS